MRTICLVPLLLSAAFSAQSIAADTLDIYDIDTEGGQAVLFVAPSGETVLIDTGNPLTRTQIATADKAAAAAGLYVETRQAQRTSTGYLIR